MSNISRRRFLSVCAAAGAFSAMPWASAMASAPIHRWNGILLGANVSLTLAHPDRKKADEIFKRCVKEIKRLENIFTLYDSHSELSMLNANGVLHNPSSDMVNILEAARIYHYMTDGAFDVTVKPLEDGKPLTLIGMDKIDIGNKSIRFAQTGMGVTLNGIAQGYITDRITALLKNEGMTNVLVELGEKRAIGYHPSNRPWLLAVQGMDDPIPLVDKALATSAARNADTGKYHIFAPSNGDYAQEHNVVSVMADNAAMADALSTGFLSMSEDRIGEIQRHQSSAFKVYLS